jgi:hypothetical protein
LLPKVRHPGSPKDATVPAFARALEQATPLRHIIPFGVLRDTTVI